MAEAELDSVVGGDQASGFDSGRRDELLSPALFRAFLASLGSTAVLTLAIAVLVRPQGSLPRAQTALIGIAFGALLLLSVLWIASQVRAQRPRPRVDRIVAPDTRSAIWLALAAWLPLLLIPVYFTARATQGPSVKWLGFGFMDKRWESSLFLLGTLAPVLLLLGAMRFIEVRRQHPVGRREWLAAFFGARAAAARVEPPDLRLASVARVTAKILTAVALAYYFFGPPWHLDRISTGIDYHEDVHFGAIQAISRGDTPYIGPAAIQYGPGAQLLSYLYMRHVGGLSVEGMRESFAFFHWMAASIFFVALFLRFRYVVALVTALAAVLIYPTLQLLGFSYGTYHGFWGWANLLRYVGAFLLLFLLPGVIERLPSKRGIAAAFALGMAWGALAYVAQENLIGGVIGAVSIALLLVLSRTASFRQVLTALAGIAGGFVVVWLPALAYYAHHHVLVHFLGLYLFVPRAVARGYSNSSFLEGLHSPWGRMFYVFPFVLALVAIASVVRLRPLRVATVWSRDRTLLVATVVTTVILYQGALLRSDTTHLIGTMLAVPAFVMAAVTLLPHALGARRRVTLVAAGLVVLVLALVLVPRTETHLSAIESRVKAPWEARRALARLPAPAPLRTLAAERIGPGLAVSTTCCSGSDYSMPRFIVLMNRIHRIVGGRTTYVAGFPDAYPGLLYFVADLKPAPIPLEPYTMVLTDPQLQAYRSDFRDRVAPASGALLTFDLGNPDTLLWLDAHKRHRVVTLEYRSKPYYILLAER